MTQIENLSPGRDQGRRGGGHAGEHSGFPADGAYTMAAWTGAAVMAAAAVTSLIR